ncbi:hypothetical protein N9D83_07695 [Amylibacter sp.]|nr:hypothetical protein [Amylibacter sp.]
MNKMIHRYLIVNLFLTVFAFEVYADEVINIPDHDSNYAVGQNLVRGFYFTAPTDFTITGIDVPTDAGASPFDASIYRLKNVTVSYDGNTYMPLSDIETLADFSDQSTAVNGLNIAVTQGEIIGAVGRRGNITSYTTRANNTFDSYIGGHLVTFTRLGANSYQSDNPLQMFTNGVYPSGRVFLTYSIAEPEIIEPEPDDDSMQYRPVAQTVNPDLFQTNIPVCENNAWLSGMSVVGNGKVTHYVDYKHKDECFKYEVKVLPEDIDSRSEAQVFKHLGSSEFDVYKYRPS